MPFIIQSTPSSPSYHCHHHHHHLLFVQTTKPVVNLLGWRLIPPKLIPSSEPRPTQTLSSYRHRLSKPCQATLILLFLTWSNTGKFTSILYALEKEVTIGLVGSPRQIRVTVEWTVPCLTPLHLHQSKFYHWVHQALPFTVSSSTLWKRGTLRNDFCTTKCVNHTGFILWSCHQSKSNYDVIVDHAHIFL